MNLANHKKNKTTSNITPILTPTLQIFYHNNYTNSTKINNTIKLPHITLLITLNIKLTHKFTQTIFP